MTEVQICYTEKYVAKDIGKTGQNAIGSNKHQGLLSLTIIDLINKNVFSTRFNLSLYIIS